MDLPDPHIDLDLYNIHATREEVEAGDVSHALASLRALLTHEAAPRLRQKVLFTIDGYGNDPRELFEVPEVREWMTQVDDAWPLWFFFLRTESPSSLLFVTLALCPFQRTTGGSEVPPRVLGDFVTARFAAMNDFCEWLGDSKEPIEQMSCRIMNFYKHALS